MHCTSDGKPAGTRLLSHWFWLLLLSTFSAIADPTPFEAAYRADFKGLPVTAKGTRSLERLADGRYRLSSEARSFLATVSEHSTFRWSEGQIYPESYEYQRRGIGRNREEIQRFQRASTGDGKESGNGQGATVIDDGVTDMLSYQLQMCEDLHHAAVSASKQSRFSYRIADGRRIKEYSFEVEGEELLETAIGNLRTVRVSRVGGSNKRETTIWLATDWEFLLVRLKQVEKGLGSFDLLLESARLGGQPVTGVAN